MIKRIMRHFRVITTIKKILQADTFGLIAIKAQLLLFLAVFVFVVAEAFEK